LVPAIIHARMCLSKKPDHKPCRNSRPTISLYSGAWRNLAVDEVPVDLARELHQLLPHVDDLVSPRAEQITRSCLLVLLRSRDGLPFLLQLPLAGQVMQRAGARRSIYRSVPAHGMVGRCAYGDLLPDLDLEITLWL